MGSIGMIHDFIAGHPMNRHNLVGALAMCSASVIFTQEYHIDHVVSIIRYKGRTVYKRNLIFDLNTYFFIHFSGSFQNMDLVTTLYSAHSQQPFQ